MPINLDEIRDLMRKLEIKRGGSPRKPHVPVEEWLRWIEPYQTREETQEIQKICDEIGGFDMESDEAILMMNRLHELNLKGEDRAYAAPIQFWPRTLQQHEDEMRAWKNYEREHPRQWVDPRTPPPAGFVYVTYYKGFIPRELMIPVGGTVTWVNRDPTTVHGHFVRHVPHTGERLFDSTNEVTWPAIEGGKSWSFTFKEAGIYEYKCQHDKYACGEGGRIIVGNINSKPDDAAFEREQLRKITPIKKR